MLSPWRVFVALVVTFSFLSVTQAGAQAPTNGVVVSSDLEILSLGDLYGSGRITWTFTGDNATLLRMKILQMFDGNRYIPPGFTFANAETGATICPCPPGTLSNGVIDPEEAKKYLEYLDLELEGQLRGNAGTEFRYTVIDRADRLEADLPANRSTEGIVGTRASTRQNIVIRYKINAASAAPERIFPQPDAALADAPHRVFSFLAAGPLSGGSCPPSCYPFPARNGWNVIAPAPQFAPGGPFLWHGNRSETPWDETETNAYEATASNRTHYSTDGFNPIPLDLRFATTAQFTFEHTGGTGTESGEDTLLVQVSPDLSAWTDLVATNDGDRLAPVDTLPLTALGNSTYNLSPYTGQRVYLRLNFTTDGDANVDGPGFYLRNLRISGPSYFNSTIEFRHVDYVVGFLSFSGFSSPSSKPALVRTPVGEVMWYSATYPRGALPADRARYAVFDFVENPQVLFVLLVVAAWLIGLFQDKLWERYRMKHPADIRASAVRVKWLHWIGKIAILFLVLFYFFPTLLGADLMVGGAAYWTMSIGSIAGLTGFTWFWYERRAKMIPKEPTIEAGEHLPGDLPPPPPPPAAEETARAICAHCDMDIVEGAAMYKCTCGQTYHQEHAAERGTCVNCGRSMKAAAPPEKRMVTLKCPTCGEINVVEETAELGVSKCTACGIILKEVPRGYNYLLIADEPHIAYEWFKSVVKRDAPGLCMSTTFPEKLRREYGLPEVELYWISDTNPGPRTLDPKRLDFEIMRAMSNFVKNHKGSALVIDGLEYLIVENSFDRVLKFIKKVNDLASVHDATMFVPITPTGLGPEEATLLRKEFDKVETLSGAK